MKSLLKFRVQLHLARNTTFQVKVICEKKAGLGHTATPSENEKMPKSSCCKCSGHPYGQSLFERQTWERKDGSLHCPLTESSVGKIRGVMAAADLKASGNGALSGILIGGFLHLQVSKRLKSALKLFMARLPRGLAHCYGDSSDTSSCRGSKLQYGGSGAVCKPSRSML